VLEPSLVTDADPSRAEARRRTLERTIAFTDAAVAIALTLLVLPLVDIANGVDQESISSVLADNWHDFFSFVLSFLVIANLWSVHRDLYETLDDYDGVLLNFNTFWLLTIVFLPFPTVLLTIEGEVPLTGVLLYLGTLVATAFLALAQTWWIARRPALRLAFATQPMMQDRVRASALVALVHVLAIGMALVHPALGLLSLLLLAGVDGVRGRPTRRRPIAGRPGPR
jgi:TMEM175 potassium channel family protein